MNFEESSLEVKSNSMLGSGDLLRLSFLNDVQEQSGNLRITFDDPPKFFIKKCLSEDEVFNIPSSDDEKRIWRITREDDIISVFCNGEAVVSFSVASSSTKCKKMWSATTSFVKFMADDKASNGYRVVSKVEETMTELEEVETEQQVKGNDDKMKKRQRGKAKGKARKTGRVYKDEDEGKSGGSI